MAIVKVKAQMNISDSSEQNENVISNNYEKEFNYETMTSELFNTILQSIITGLKVEENLNNTSGIEQPGLSTGTKSKKTIQSFNVSFDPVADDTRKIIIVQGYQQQAIDFIKDLNEVKLFTHPSKFNHVYFVEKGFADLPILQVRHMDFLTNISNCIEKEDLYLEELQEYFLTYSINMEGNLMSKFSFIFEGIKWEVENHIPKFNS